MKKKLIISSVIIGVLAILFIGFKYTDYSFNESGGIVSERKFEKLEDKSLEVVDTSVFLDENLEKWYLENRKEKGEVIFEDTDHTYVLVSLGEVKESNTLLLLKGLKEEKGKLLVAYEPFETPDMPSIDFPDDVRSTLIKVEGNYKSVEAIEVKE